MALRVEVAGFGLTNHAPRQVIFIICVQQENFEAWYVYRRFQHFQELQEQLMSHQSTLSGLPVIDVNNLNLDYLEHARHALDRWLQVLASNTYILRLQAMYHFLCNEANLIPPYLDVHLKKPNSNNQAEMDMDEMFETEGDGEEDWEEDELEDMDEDRPQEDEMDHNGGKKNGRRPTATGATPRQSMKKRNMETDGDKQDGFDIQSLSFVEAELTYDKKDKTVEESAKKTINLDAFKIIKVIGKGEIYQIDSISY